MLYPFDQSGKPYVVKPNARSLFFMCCFCYFQSVKKHVDHQAEAYVAPRRVMAEANGNAPAKAPAAVTANGKPKWGGAEVCPRCDKSVIIFCF